MTKTFFGQRTRLGRAVSALSVSMLLLTSCGTNQKPDEKKEETKTDVLSSLVISDEDREIESKGKDLVVDVEPSKPLLPSWPIVDAPAEHPGDTAQQVPGFFDEEKVPLTQPAPNWNDATQQHPVYNPDDGVIVDEPIVPICEAERCDTVSIPAPIHLVARSHPEDPSIERFQEAWQFNLYNIDDYGQQTGPRYAALAGSNGEASVILPQSMVERPLVITAHNDILALEGAPSSFEIFVPANCHDKALWLAGPFESALWSYYKKADARFGEAWNSSQVDCVTWLASSQLLVLTDEIDDAFSDADVNIQSLEHAFINNPHLLTPTRTPFCFAERRHSEGSMEGGNRVQAPFTLDNPSVWWNYAHDVDSISIGDNGIVNDLCGVALTGKLLFNAHEFAPTFATNLDDDNFIGVIHRQELSDENLHVSTFNVKLGNGADLESDRYNDACALTSVIQFTNTDDDEQDIEAPSGVTFSDLFGDGANTALYATSDGDDVVDDKDTWAIFYQTPAVPNQERVIAVELLGHRQEDFRDVLRLNFDASNDDLSIGLRADYELNEAEVDGEQAYLAYTLHVWDGSTEEGRRLVQSDAVNCFSAADPLARQFFDSSTLNVSALTPLAAAEFAVRSQCFSNSRANQRWQTDDAGFWSMNTTHGVIGNVLVNTGWLAPHTDYEVYVQKFDEAVFKGPRSIKRTDDIGQLMIEIPTLVEGDRVLLKADGTDYDLVMPCVPEFTGFTGAPGVPFVPGTLTPPPAPPFPGR